MPTPFDGVSPFYKAFTHHLKIYTCYLNRFLKIYLFYYSHLDNVYFLKLYYFFNCPIIMLYKTYNNNNNGNENMYVCMYNEGEWEDEACEEQRVTCHVATPAKRINSDRAMGLPSLQTIGSPIYLFWFDSTSPLPLLLLLLPSP